MLNELAKVSAKWLLLLLANFAPFLHRLEHNYHVTSAERQSADDDDNININDDVDEDDDGTKTIYTRHPTIINHSYKVISFIIAI